MSRLLDAEIAVNEHGWVWEEAYNRKLLVPPEGDPRRGWAAMWDQDGIPHWLPNYSEGQTDE